VSGHDSVPVIGLVGGVGSGKSSVARRLASQRRLKVIDGDALGHKALADPSIQSQLRTRFGDSIFEGHGQVNRSALARVVFGPEVGHRRARADLESIVHPQIRREIEWQIAAARSTENVEAVLLDAAVLFEAGWNELCDAVVFVDVPEPRRIERVRSRGWDDGELRKREASQMPVEEKRRACEYQINNSGDLDEAARELSEILDRILHF
jgi:dephospho-CoA kinase